MVPQKDIPDFSKVGIIARVLLDRGHKKRKGVFINIMVRTMIGLFRCWRGMICLVLVIVCFSREAVSQPQTYTEYKASQYKVLDSALYERKKQLVSYLSDIQAKAHKIQEDQFSLDCFKIINTFQTLQQTDQLTPQLLEKTSVLRKMFQEHYVRLYNCFYDVLFINQYGNIFYTIRQQNDYLKNIFEGELNDTALSERMRSLPSESFVDFQFYKISGEPSAFFIEPVKDDKGLYGWIILQFAINKINSMFSCEREIGATGEIFLVNQDHYMLTDSRFNAESTILKEQLSAENIVSKFAEGKGHKEVVDYRGQNVISSFEVFDFLDSQWLIIAKMDEAEIFTAYYLQNPLKLKKKIEYCLSYHSKYGHRIFSCEKCDEVDMDEFRRSNQNQTLYTHGISTCTAFFLKYSGQFTYLAHISPYDKAYKGKRTDLIAHILKKVEYLEITESDRHKLRFYVISPSKTAFSNIIFRLIDHGYFLSQIKLMHNPDAVHANIRSNGLEDEVLVNWKMNDTLYYLEKGSDRPSLQQQIEMEGKKSR